MSCNARHAPPFPLRQIIDEPLSIGLIHKPSTVLWPPFLLVVSSRVRGRPYVGIVVNTDAWWIAPRFLRQKGVLVRAEFDLLCWPDVCLDGGCSRVCIISASLSWSSGFGFSVVRWLLSWATSSSPWTVLLSPLQLARCSNSGLSGGGDEFSGAWMNGTVVPLQGSVTGSGKPLARWESLLISNVGSYADILVHRMACPVIMVDLLLSLEPVYTKMDPLWDLVGPTSFIYSEGRAGQIVLIAKNFVSFIPTWASSRAQEWSLPSTYYWTSFYHGIKKFEGTWMDGETREVQVCSFGWDPGDSYPSVEFGSMWISLVVVHAFFLSMLGLALFVRFVKPDQTAFRFSAVLVTRPNPSMELRACLRMELSQTNMKYVYALSDSRSSCGGFFLCLEWRWFLLVGLRASVLDKRFDSVGLYSLCIARLCMDTVSCRLTAS